jgi:hypothetical protein
MQSQLLLLTLYWGRNLLRPDLQQVLDYHGKQDSDDQSIDADRFSKSADKDHVSQDYTPGFRVAAQRLHSAQTDEAKADTWAKHSQTCSEAST